MGSARMIRRYYIKDLSYWVRERLWYEECEKKKKKKKSYTDQGLKFVSIALHVSIFC